MHSAPKHSALLSGRRSDRVIPDTLIVFVTYLLTKGVHSCNFLAPGRYGLTSNGR